MIVLELRGGDADEGWVQPLADDRLWCDVRLPGVSGEPMRRPTPVAPLELAADAALVYDGPGDIGGAVRRIRCWRDDRGVRRVEVEEGTSFLVGARGERVQRVVNAGSATVDARVIETALGAPLVLALAVRGVFVLHASAFRVRVGGGVVALTAATGVGKSTLAAGADDAGRGWSRVADDQLPVRLASRSLALPRFPQLKLPDLGSSMDAPPSLPLLAVVEIERRPPTDTRGVEIEALSPSEACAALGRATVAARLFDPELLATHLAAMVAATPALVVARVRFGHGLDRRAEVLERIAGFVAGGTTPADHADG